MAPVSRKRKSEAMDETPQPHTPTGSPARKKLRITQSQKQALIDNLQLESMQASAPSEITADLIIVTERARHLRAHYALQCADLRSRIERRVNRIPTAMRKMTMGELMAKHAQPQPSMPPQHLFRVPSDTNKTLPPLPHEASQPTKHVSPFRSNIAPPMGRGKKRKSSHIEIASDGDAFTSAPESLPVAKKTRGKTAATGTTRAASRTVKPNSVLSPRSHNSRTLPRSPVKEYNSPSKYGSPAKSYIARPISPLKPASPLKSAATAATSAISAAAHGMMEQAKRGAVTAGKLSRQASREKAATTAATTAAARNKMLPPPRPVPSAPSSPMRTTSASSNITSASDMSTTSTSTTVVTKPKRGRVAAKPASSEEQSCEEGSCSKEWYGSPQDWRSVEVEC